MAMFAVAALWVYQNIWLGGLGDEYETDQLSFQRGTDPGNAYVHGAVGELRTYAEYVGV